jgi:pyruvate formate lyase activating enzyme
MNGRIVDIKRMTVHDGPGIRTTIFMKGCPLHCPWCHNPESIAAKPEIGFFKRKCVGCGECAEVCPNGAHIFQNGEHIFKRELCVGCGKCVEACLPGALEYYGRKISVEDVVKKVLEDKTFYEKSGGGCTISGGEPLLQVEFCVELFKKLKYQKIHCAIDTSGAVPWSAFEKVLPLTDLFLYDVKHIDKKLHQEQIGSSNKMILENLKHLSECSRPIEIRIPTIPGFNADEKSMTAIGQYLSGLKNITAVKLLPYHQARSKYETVGYSDTMLNVTPPMQEQIAYWSELLRQFGLNVK